MSQPQFSSGTLGPAPQSVVLALVVGIAFPTVSEQSQGSELVQEPFAPFRLIWATHAARDDVVAVGASPPSSIHVASHGWEHSRSHQAPCEPRETGSDIAIFSEFPRSRNHGHQEEESQSRDAEVLPAIDGFST